MPDRFTALLSDHLDHDLPRSEGEALERHLESCVECRELLAGLAAVKNRAASLVDPPAPNDLWAGIASRIGTAGSTSEVAPRRAFVLELPRRRSTWAVPGWLAAAAAFAVVAAAAVWFAQGRLAGPTSGGVALRDGSSGTTAPAEPVLDAAAAGFDAGRIEQEIRDLRAALERGRDRLAPETVQVLEDNLVIIHKALEDARAALEKDPSNADLREYFAGSVERKLDLVRRAAMLAGV
jgi:hypothetical protein